MKKVLIIILSIFFFSFSYGFDIEFDGLADMFKRKLVGIHFVGGGNDFGGMFFVTGEKDIGNETIDLGGGNKKENCKYLLKGYYYNPLHGQIMYPLDNETKEFWQDIDSNNYKDLVIDGGFYRGCDGDPDSIFGQIKYKKGSFDIFTMYAGFKYNADSNSIIWDFADSLQYYIDNEDSNIVGLLYDSSNGIGFVGGRVNTLFADLVDEINDLSVKEVIVDIGTYKIDNIVGADIDSIFGIGLTTNLYVNGFMNLGSNQNNDSLAFKSFIKLAQKNNTVTLTSELVNIGVVLNKIRRNSEILCDGNWNTLIDLSNINTSSEGKTVCIKTDNSVINVNNDLTLNGKVTNIIVKGNNNKLVIKASQEGPGYVNIFVDNGAVLFDNSINLFNINGEGYIDNTNPVTSGAVFNGNIFVNGLIAGSNGGTISQFNHRLYMYGSVGSLNTIGANVQRFNYISSLGLDTDFADITQNFAWECLQNGKGTDGVNCGSEEDNYMWNSIIIKKQDYKNPLLK